MSFVQSFATHAGRRPRARRKSNSARRAGSNLLGTVTVLAAVLTAFACSEARTPLDPPASTQSAQAATPASLGWQLQARNQVGAHNLSPLAAARVYAALSVAQYDAINKSDDVGYKDGVLPASGFGQGGRSRYELERGAVAGASWLVLNFFFADSAAALERHLRAEANSFADNPHPQFERGLGAGVSAAARMIDRLKADHFADPWTGTLPTGPGKWINNGPPSGPGLGKMTPYLLTSTDQFRSVTPPSFGSAAFLTGLNEISTLSATRTPDQLASARFWNYATGTPTPPGYWNEIASSIIEANRLDERATAHVLALMNSAVLDAVIGCWEAKYVYSYIRPSQVEATITLPIGLPNHPSYPSGHSCVSSSAARVLSRFFPSETAQLEEKVRQAGLSRMYAGIHYRFDIEAGQTLGRAVAEWAISIDNRDGMLAAIK